MRGTSGQELVNSRRDRDMRARTRDLVGLLPYEMRDKVGYYLNYVNDRLIDIADEEGKGDRITEIRDEFEIIFLLKLLYGHFVVGFQNYESLLDFFEAKNISGFTIGSSSFSRQNKVQSEQSLDNDWRTLQRDLLTLISNLGYTRYMRVSVDTVIRDIVGNA